jgi:hypothetical protein
MEINSLTNKIDVNLEIISNLINSSIQIVVSYAGQGIRSNNYINNWLLLSWQAEQISSKKIRCV